MTKCSPAIPVLVQDEGGRAEVGQVRLYGPIALEELEEIRSKRMKMKITIFDRLSTEFNGQMFVKYKIDIWGYVYIYK